MICMEKMKKIKEALAKLVKEMYSNYPSDKGLLVIEGDELEVGATVEIEDEDGNRTVAEDGDYILEDKTKIVVADGRISEIVEPEPEVVSEPEEAPAEEEVAAEDIENPTNDGEESEPEAIVKLREEVNELYRIIDELKARIETLEKKPTAAPATEEFEKIKKDDTTDKRVKNPQKFFE